MIAESLITLFIANARGVMQHNYAYSLETHTKNQYAACEFDDSYLRSLYVELLNTYTDALTREIQTYAPAFIPPSEEDLELCLTHLISVSPSTVKTFLKERLILNIVIDSEHLISLINSL